MGLYSNSYTFGIPVSMESGQFSAAKKIWECISDLKSVYL